MKLTWIVIANSNRGLIYAADAKNPSNFFSIVRALKHPASKQRNQDLVSDKSGHYQAAFSVRRGSYSSPTEPHEYEIEQFAREIAKTLEDGRVLNQYQKLILIMAPHFYGILIKHLNDPVKVLIQQVIQKNLIEADINELQNVVHSSLHGTGV